MANVFQVDTGGTLTNGLRAYYKLDDDSLDAWNMYDMTNNGGVAYVAGLINNAPDFSGNNGSKWFQVLDNLGITTGDISASFWVKIATEVDGSRIGYYPFIHDAGGIENAILYEYNGGSPRLHAQHTRYGVNTWSAFYAGSLADNAWHHVVFTIDASNQIVIYVDGVAGTPTTGLLEGGGAPTVPNRTSLAGHSGRFDISFDGVIDEVGVWNKALVAQEITDLYNAGVGNTLVPEATVEPIAQLSTSAEGGRDAKATSTALDFTLPQDNDATLIMFAHGSSTPDYANREDLPASNTRGDARVILQYIDPVAVTPKLEVLNASVTETEVNGATNKEIVLGTIPKNSFYRRVNFIKARDFDGTPTPTKWHLGLKA